MIFRDALPAILPLVPRITRRSSCPDSRPPSTTADVYTKLSPLRQSTYCVVTACLRRLAPACGKSFFLVARLVLELVGVGARGGVSQVSQGSPDAQSRESWQRNRPCPAPAQRVQSEQQHRAAHAPRIVHLEQVVNEITGKMPQLVAYFGMSHDGEALLKLVPCRWGVHHDTIGDACGLLQLRYSTDGLPACRPPLHSSLNLAVAFIQRG